MGYSDWNWNDTAHKQQERRHFIIRTAIQNVSWWMNLYIEENARERITGDLLKLTEIFIQY